MEILKENFNQIEVYIFGASAGGGHVYDIFTNLGIKIAGFVDNSEKKWGTLFREVIVHAPEILNECTENQKIVIASTYHDEITGQLLAMGIAREKIVMKDQLIRDALCLKEPERNVFQYQGGRVLFDLSEGFILSGVVNWTINLVEQMHQDKEDFYVLSMKRKDGNYDYGKIADRIFWADYRLGRYRQSVEETMDFIEAKLPCKIVINQISQIFWAACLVKQKYKDQIEIVSIIHSDFSRIYEQNAFLDGFIDSYICVSREIYGAMKEKYRIAEEKLHYRPTSTEYDREYQREAAGAQKALAIAYAARIEKAQKRADLLLPLIRLLEKSGMDYRLNIAGDGTYYKELENFIRSQGVTERVTLYGALPYDAMRDFWKENDIFINLSDIEGMPVSLLEAMSWGCVPVVTKTSGTKATVEEGVNGFICERENVDSVFEKILLLDRDREQLYKMAGACRNRVEERHGRREYVRFLMEDV